MDDKGHHSNFTLCDVFDRVLTSGVVAHGDITISCAGVELLTIRLRALVAAIDALEDPSGTKMVASLEDR